MKVGHHRPVATPSQHASNEFDAFCSEPFVSLLLRNCRHWWLSVDWLTPIQARPPFLCVARDKNLALTMWSQCLKRKLAPLALSPPSLCSESRSATKPLRLAKRKESARKQTNNVLAAKPQAPPQSANPPETRNNKKATHNALSPSLCPPRNRRTVTTCLFLSSSSFFFFVLRRRSLSLFFSSP